MNLDRRTRSDEDLRVIDIDEFFTSGFLEFPKTRKALAAEGIRYLGARSLALKVRDSTWTVTAGSALTAQRGAPEDVALVELDEGRFSNWIQQQVTFNALLTAGTVQLERGSKRDLAAWDAAWLALLEGWPVSTEGLQFEDRDGAPLDLQRAFTPEDSPLDIAHFFRKAGYLHLRGWLGDHVMAKIGDEIDAALPSYREGDGRSWWATVDGGARAACGSSTSWSTPPRLQPCSRVRNGRQSGRRSPARTTLSRRLSRGTALRPCESPSAWSKGCRMSRGTETATSVATPINAPGLWLESPLMPETTRAVCCVSSPARTGSACQRTEPTSIPTSLSSPWQRTAATSRSTRVARCMRPHRR